MQMTPQAAAEQERNHTIAEARAITVAYLFDRAARSPWALCAARYLRALTSGPCAACGRSVQAHALNESRACAAWLVRPLGPAPVAWESCISATPAPPPPPPHRFPPAP